MIESVVFERGRADAARIGAHLYACDAVFVPQLSGRVNVSQYAGKLAAKAQCFEAWVGDELVGLVAVYCNAQDKGVAFISSVSVLPAWQGRGIASQLLEACIAHVGGLGFSCVDLEVDGGNDKAIFLYMKHGFIVESSEGNMVKMRLDLRKGNK